MAIIEVKMQSGWSADKKSLSTLLADKDILLKKFEINKDGAVQLYFDQVSQLLLLLLLINSNSDSE